MVNNLELLKNAIIDKELDLIGVILNNGKILESKLSHYPRLKEATEQQLQKWQLIGNGVGISWKELDEDLSVKGFIHQAAINEMLEHLQTSTDQEKATA